MRRLSSLLRHRLRTVLAGADRGNIALLVTIVLGGGVLLGAGALSVDVGQLYAEREQLQSGADAAAMAVAQNCIRTPAACGNQNAPAVSYANRNAKDGASAVTLICGRATGLAGCPAPTGNRWDCMGAPPPAGPYAEVRTATLQPDGSTLLPPTFAQTLVGNQGYKGARLAACSRVAWGPPLQATGLGVTVSTCDWQRVTGGAPAYLPPGTLPPASAEGVLYLHSTSGANTCPAGPSGWDAPGGFGWLDDPTNTCSSTVAANGTYGGDSGLAPSKACSAALASLYTTHTPVLMPIFDGVRGTGQNTVYHLSGFSSFVLTGYNLPSTNSPASWLTGRTYCTGSAKCLYGYFVTAILPTGGSFGTIDYGTEILKVVG
ncbi:pilus assembly protein TadG-related protein [Planosporangium thailandense]|uniref:pilus assembly protein TadG-related protein n=1 Tax=Planosporangium thailandense TaxID=765197 RepID=UPI00197C7790|nr:pilus assembly protein TadG-related protein [Planosporangium thailandense]